MTSQQRSLFEGELNPWELDDERQRLVATLVLPAGPEGEFDYLVPDSMRADLEIGCRVRAPFGRASRSVMGYCVRLETRVVDPRRQKLKTLERAIDRRSLLSPAMLRMTQWMADYYLSRWGQVLEAVVPAGVRGGAGTRHHVVIRADAVASAWTVRTAREAGPGMKILAGLPAP